MAVSSHMGAVAVAELDLSASCGPNTIVDRINAMPALKTSAAFFTFLRANLVLPHSAISSNVSTPYLSPSDALTLITDSIIQQRHQTALSLLSHPLVLTVLSALLLTIHQYAYVPHAPSFRLALLLVLALLTAFLLAVHRLSAGYLSAAAAFHTAPGDVLIAARLGPTLVGALILHLEPTVASPARNGKKHQHQRSASLRGGKGVIRAWTVRRGYRGQGFGGELLREAARLTRERCGASAEIGFAAGHANSTRVLPEVFNGGLRRGEVRAARALEGVVARGKR
ncbi:hypothetical protein B0T18DRAFT_429606 [Schizothecium vesticola]|uniref:N-acetyltransferase domain-containing protein n=1 Tax=Schizothecium vesticola TaxID=314040 RepID=A0AA40EWA6_9PEZI|nr:hypothetical protein B0T18DRAFT_429606 [Schizothecium vesticola]